MVTTMGGSLPTPVSLSSGTPTHLLLLPLLLPNLAPKLNRTAPVTANPNFLCSGALLLSPANLQLHHRSHLSPSGPGPTEEEDPEAQVQELRVPDSWLLPSVAEQESEWLRVTLHKWLDDEYCPEPTNAEISEVAARSFNESLTAKQANLADILLKMAGDLESSVSFQESFHGAFSSANAAIHLITSRLNSVSGD